MGFLYFPKHSETFISFNVYESTGKLRKMKRPISLWLEEEMHQTLDQEAEKTCGTRGQIVRRILQEYFKNGERKK